MSKQIKQTRYAMRSAEVRATDGAAAVIVGTPVVFNEESEDLGGFREIIVPGAFGAVADQSTPIYQAHRSELVLGRVGNTATAEERNDGIHITVTPPASAAWVVDSIRRGDAPGMSFGFRTDYWDPAMVNIQFDRERDVMIAKVMQGEIMEYSAGVAIPAYPQTDSEVRDRMVAMRSSALSDPDGVNDNPEVRRNLVHLALRARELSLVQIKMQLNT